MITKVEGLLGKAEQACSILQVGSPVSHGKPGAAKTLICCFKCF